MPKVAEIHTITFRLPMASPLNWGQAGHLDALEHVLVRLITDTGQVGLAEAPPRPSIYGETPESVQTIIQNYLAPKLLGLDIEDFESIKRQMATIANNPTAKGAIDICLHEAIAASREQSLLEYLNPPFQKIKVSYILGLSDHDTMLAEAKAVYDQGVRVFKVKVGRNFADDLARIRILQNEFRGSPLWLYVDANEGLLPVQANLQLHQLANQGVLFIEEPLPIEMISERASLREREILPIIADDSTFTPRALNRELQFDTFDILNIKIARTGYSDSRQMLSMAKQHNKGVMVGSQASSTLGTVRAAIFAGLEGIDYPCELSFYLKLEDEIVNRPLKITDGYIDLGSLADITVDEQRLQQCRI
jgi:L-alanine-DL-glutamate epimerase-like enolase superfamily enzyme